MADIRIDTRNLTYTQFVIPEQNSGWIEGADVPTISLVPGEYGFQQISGMVADFRFEVTPDGLIEYNAINNEFLDGRGTTTLIIVGFTISFDARPLSHDLQPIMIGGSDLSRDRTHELTLVPAAGYGFYPASGIVADFRFDITVDGQINLNPRYMEFALANGRTLTVNGYRVTIDGRALSHDLLPVSMLGGIDVLTRDRTHEFTYIPAAGYSFQPAAGLVADFCFDVDVNGQVVIDPRYAGFAAASGRMLTVNGYQITVDGRQLAYDIMPLLLGNADILTREITHDLSILPVVGFGFFADEVTVVLFNLDVAGTILVNPLYSGAAHASGRIVILGQGASLAMMSFIDVIQAPTMAHPGESVRVQVVLRQDAPPDTQVTIHGLAVHDVWLQAPGRLGEWKIPVIAASGTDRDRRVITMAVSGTPCAPVLQIANDPFAPLNIILRAIDLDPENRLLNPGDVYQWRIGEIVATTAEPIIAQDLTAQVDDQRSWKSLPVQLTVVHTDGSMHKVERTLVLGSTYRFLRDSLNQVRPPISTDGQAKQTGFLHSTYRGHLQIRNIEPTGLRFTLRRVEWLVIEGEEVTFAAEEAIDLRVEANTAASMDVTFDRQHAPLGTFGAIVHMLGQTDDNLPVHTSGAFELIRTQAFIRPPDVPKVKPDLIIPDLDLPNPVINPTILDKVADLVDLQGGSPFVIGAMTGGLVTLPEKVRVDGLTQHHVWTLQLAANAVGGEQALTTLRGRQLSTFAAAIQSQGVAWPTRELLVPGAVRNLAEFRDAASVSEGAPCDPDNLPDEIPEFFACQFMGEYEDREVPARIANARKGDIILVPGGNGLIGGLLANVEPLQRYAHCGIMTKNFVEVSHATASEDWLRDHARGVDPLGATGQTQPTNGFDPTALRFQWPGGITQSISSAYGGSEFTNPDIEVEEDDPQNPGQKRRVKKKYRLAAFNLVDKAFLNEQWQIIEPLVIKPHPVAEHNDPNLRNRLYQVANKIRELCVNEAETAIGRQSKVHYRFHCYTDAALAVRPSPYGVDGPNAPAHAGWAAGTLPAVCSSIIWLAAKQLDVQLEGSGDIIQPSDFEALDLLAGAQTDEQTLDGLYLYTEGERRHAAEWLVNYLSDKIFETAQEEGGWFGGLLNEIFSDMADDCANQITNTFAFDWADSITVIGPDLLPLTIESKDSDRWKNPGIGWAVSPDNMMLWDKPEQGGRGLWGYTEPLVHYPARVERVPITKWRQTTGPGTLKGTIRFRGQPVPGANLNVGGTMTTASGDGQFSMTLLEGFYILKASAFMDPSIGLTSTTVRVEVKLNETTTVDVNLQPPPDQYRLVEIDAFIEFRDDEDTPFPDEHALDSKIWRLPVQPWDTEETIFYTKGWGGECRIEAKITAKLNFDRSVDVTLSGDLFEGTSESTNDRDGSGSATWRIPKDAVGEQRDLKISNTEEDEADTYAWFKLKITNRTQ
jgi:hypothetical protein